MTEVELSSSLVVDLNIGINFLFIFYHKKPFLCLFLDGRPPNFPPPILEFSWSSRVADNILFFFFFFTSFALGSMPGWLLCFTGEGGLDEDISSLILIPDVSVGPNPCQPMRDNLGNVNQSEMSIYLMSLVSRTRACGWSTRWRNVFIFSGWLLGQCHSWTESILSMWCAQCRVTVSQSIQVLTNITEVQETKWSTHLSTNQLRDFLCFNQSEERFLSVNQSGEMFFLVNQS